MKIWWLIEDGIIYNKYANFGAVFGLSAGVLIGTFIKGQPMWFIIGMIAGIVIAAIAILMWFVIISEEITPWR